MNTGKPTLPPRHMMAPAPQGNGACTHMTMSRLYTDAIRCPNCRQISSYGWLLKCTQDTELTYEDELEKGIRSSQLDKYCEIFEPPTAPKKRSPAARTSSRLSFLDEISDEALKTYTPAKLKAVLEQRAHCQDVALAASEESARDSGLHIVIPDYSPSRSSSRWSQSSGADNPAKPWLASKECSYKICSKCRHSYIDRTWLSMNAIADGELPLTAVMGHGFQFRQGEQRRHVAPNSIVEKLGLTPVPHIQGPGAVLISLAQTKPSIPDLETRRRQLFPHLFEDATRVEDPLLAADKNIITQSGSQAPAPMSGYTQPAETLYNPEVEEIFARMTMGPKRLHPPGLHSHARSASYSGPFLTQQYKPETPELPQSLPPSPSAPEIAAKTHDGFPDLAASSPTAPTPMEQTEKGAGLFNSTPLEVNSGVAVTEEGVGLHVPDIVLENHWLDDDEAS
ncbi:hypothetical protein PVAG01_04947 [Phlyctema vagabunda]|uniref:Uncharacterized protein n=1 Tax=Phlyctema vagabunda TaxID=108571 RepID=A0ABR4PIQ5_9HELO